MGSLKTTGKEQRYFNHLSTVVPDIKVITSQNLGPAKFDKNLNQNAESRCNNVIL